MYYELWDTETRNLVDWFWELGDLLLTLAHSEIDSLDGLAVAERDEHGHTRWLKIEMRVSETGVCCPVVQ